MIVLTAKIAALTVLIALGSLMSGSAHAAILLTAEGVPVLTKEGAPVLTGINAAEFCDRGASAEAAEFAPAQERVVYFNFNKSGLTKHARHQLSHLAKKLRAHPEKTIAIVGFADRMGDADYNEKLAMKRAKTVRDFLVAKGIKAKKIGVRSLGKAAPKADCPAELPRAKMISCLSEDRRVEIEVK